MHAPATRDEEAAIQSAVVDLADPEKRAEAETRIREFGPLCVRLLKVFLDSDQPEVRDRVKAILVDRSEPR